jgi:asparagine synthase (glutamine-hydrolysing)
MSGICGLFNLDGGPATEPDLRAMTSLLERRGPEGTSRWQDGPVGVGHTMLATTPELLLERQPFRHHETGCVITADVRLDSRDALLGSLGLKERCDSVGDAELILTAYLQWGEQCLSRLLGDFAFAIWDPRCQTLFCARDHFGLRPLYYHHTPQRIFAFASEPRSILVLPCVPYCLNDGRIADFLVPELEWIDYTSTFFEGIYRLPPGHKITVTPAQLVVSEYWRPEPGPDLGPMSDEDYALGFLEVFTTAVEARLRAPAHSIGAMLSGGMDSGSVVAVAKELYKSRGDGALSTFSVARDAGVECAESRAIYAAFSMPSISPTVILPDALDSMIPQLTSGHEEPFDGELALLKAIYLAAQGRERKVVVDGAGGDVVLGAGSHITRLIRKGQLFRACTEIIGANKFWDRTPLAVDFALYVRAALVPEFLKRGLRGVLDPARARQFLKTSLIAPDFARRVHIAERFMRLRRTFPADWTPDHAVERCDAILPNMTAGRERYGRQAAAAGIEARDPFLDKRVVDYCTRLPGRVLMSDGWPKMLLRKLMAGRLPDEVRWCIGKPHLGMVVISTIVQRLAEHGELRLDDLQTRLEGYVDPAALEGAWQDFMAGRAVARIYTAYLLGTWLDENVKRPIATVRADGYSPVTVRCGP